MKPRPIRMPDSLWDELGEEAEERGLSTAEYVRKVLRNRQADTPNTQPDTQALAERVEELEAAVFDERSSEHTDPPARDSGAVDVDGTGEDTGGAEIGATEASAEPELDFLTEYRMYLEDNGPKKRQARQQIVRLLEALRERGPLETNELKDILEEEVGDEYQDRKSMWQSYDRHLKTLAGFEKADYGKWGFSGEEETKEQMNLTGRTD